MSCQSNTLSSISSKPIFEDTSFNILLSIVIPKLLLNLVSCHGFMKKPNSTVILNFRTHMINNYLEKGLYIIERGTKQLSLKPNDVILRINMNNQLDTYYVLKKNAIYAVANTIKQLHVQKYMNMVYKQDFYKDKHK